MPGANVWWSAARREGLAVLIALSLASCSAAPDPSAPRSLAEFFNRYPYYGETGLTLNESRPMFRHAKRLLPSALDDLRDPDPAVRERAVLFLRESRHWAEQSSSIVEAILPLLADPDPGVRTQTIIALWYRLMLDVPDARLYVPRFVPLLRDTADVTDGSYSRPVCVSAMEVFSAPWAIGYAPEVAALLSESNPKIVASAIETLGAMKARQYGPQIAQLLTYRNADKVGRSRVIEAALSVLVSWNARTYQGAIAALLQDRTFHSHQTVVDALVRLEAVEYADQIAALVSDEPRTVLDGLFRLGARQQLQDIGKNAPNPYIRDTAILMLQPDSDPATWYWHKIDHRYPGWVDPFSDLP